MITIKGNTNKLIIKGHADYSEYGKDIVCASVSTAINVTVNGILRINDKAIEYIDDGKVITITNKSNDNITNELLLNLMSILKSLESNYPKNLKFEMEE